MAHVKQPSTVDAYWQVGFQGVTLQRTFDVFWRSLGRVILAAKCVKM